MVKNANVECELEISSRYKILADRLILADGFGRPANRYSDYIC